MQNTPQVTAANIWNLCANNDERDLQMDKTECQVPA